MLACTDVPEQTDSDPADANVTTSQKGSLPEKRPPHTVFSLKTGGGMRNISSHIQFSDTASFISLNYFEAENTLMLKVSQEELDQLYQVFLKQRFHKIKTFESQTFDRGGVNISLSMGEDYMHIADGGSTYIKDGYQDNFDAITKAINELAAQKMEAFKHSFVVEFDKSITDSGKYLYLEVDSGTQYYTEEDGPQSQQELYLFEGRHYFNVYLIDPDVPSHKRRAESTHHFVYTTTKDSNRITLYLGKDKIEYK